MTPSPTLHLNTNLYFVSAFLLSTSDLRISSCSLSDIAYLRVGIAERSIPIAGGIEIRKNIASAYLPAPVPPS